jgi:hypothetical protein
MRKQNFILRKDNGKDYDGDRFCYWVEAVHNVDMVTPFRDKATRITGPTVVNTRGWEAIKVSK